MYCNVTSPSIAAAAVVPPFKNNGIPLLWCSDPLASPLARGEVVGRYRVHNRFEWHIEVRCPFCRGTHTHGWDPRNDHRVCEPRSPGCGQDGDRGYWISVVHGAEGELR